ncbi:MAG: penicillin-binding protein 2 [Roseiflexaceae bacterium]
MALRQNQNQQPVTISRWRVNAMLIVMVLLVGRIGAQLVDIQVVRHAELRDRARSEIDQQIPIQPNRGVIRDRKGNVLALDVQFQSLFVQPHFVDPKEAPRMAAVLSGLTGTPMNTILTELTNTKYQWRPIARWLKPEIAERIGLMMEAEPAVWQGLQFVYEPRRVYPQDSFAAHVLGAVNREGVGISGVEGYYDTILKGSTGVITAEVDATQRPIWIAPTFTEPASDGYDLELTIDPLIQHTIETELQKAIEDHDADGGTIIVLDVKTGAIRGMASYPTFNPNVYEDYPAELYNINPAIGSLYEPGSTFKIATVAIGLDAGAFTTNTTVDDPGSIYRYGWNLSNWNGGGNGAITPAKVLYYSSNVGALQLGEMTGVETFYKKLGELGYGKLTGVDMAGEGPGLVWDPNAPDFSPLSFNTNAYGQGIAVTPLQQVRMVATIGNDGMLMRPYIVERRCHADACIETQPKVMGQPIKPEVARTVRMMLVDSANHYAPVVWAERTGSYEDTWLVPGYKVAAKTGTSTVPNGRGGFEDWTIGSVAGLVPAEQPRYAVLVKIDHPKDDIWGVSTAIPVYQVIASRLVTYERIAPDPALYGPGQTPDLAAQDAQRAGDP